MTGKVKVHLMSHPNSSQMICNLQQEIKETLSKRLPATAGMVVVESLADTLASCSPAQHFSRFLVPAIAILVLAAIILLALKCSLAYLHKTVKQNNREKAVLTGELNNRQWNYSLNRSGRCGRDPADCRICLEFRSVSTWALNFLSRLFCFA